MTTVQYDDSGEDVSCIVTTTTTIRFPKRGDGGAADVLRRLDKLERKDRIMAGELDELAEEIPMTETVDDSILALVDGLTGKVADLSGQLQQAGNNATALSQVRQQAASLTAELKSKR